MRLGLRAQKIVLMQREDCAHATSVRVARLKWDDSQNVVFRQNKQKITGFKHAQVGMRGKKVRLKHAWVGSRGKQDCLSMLPIEMLRFETSLIEMLIIKMFLIEMLLIEAMLTTMLLAEMFLMELLLIQ